MAIRSIRIHYVYILYELHYVPPSTVRTKRTVREHEQSEKSPFGYNSRRISHSSCSSTHFLITMKNGIEVDQRNWNDCRMIWMRLSEENSLALVPFSKFRFHLPGKKIDVLHLEFEERRQFCGGMTGTDIVRFTFMRNCKSRMLGLRILFLFFCLTWLADLNITPFRITRRLYVIWTVRLIRHAQHTSRDSTLGAGT